MNHLERGLPAVVLVSEVGLLLHCLVLVGWNAAAQLFLCLDTNNELSTVSLAEMTSRIQTYLGTHAILFQ